MATYPINRKDAFLISVIFVLGVLFRALYLSDYRHTDVFYPLQFTDSDFFLQRAKEILVGDFLNREIFSRWPLYSYFLALVLKLASNTVSSVYLLQFLLGVLSSLFVYFTARLLFEKRSVAFIAGLLHTFYGLFIFYEGLLMYTTLSLFLNLLLFLFILHIKDNPTKEKMFWFGFFLGVSTAAQASIILFGFPVAVWVLYQSRLKPRRFVSAFVLFLIGLGIVLGALLTRSLIKEKDFFVCGENAGFNFFIGNNPQSDGTLNHPAYLVANGDSFIQYPRMVASAILGRAAKPSDVSSFWFRQTAGFIRAHPIAWLRLLLLKSAYVFSPTEFIYEPEYFFLINKIRIFKVMFLNLGFIIPFAFFGMLTGLKKVKETAPLYIAVAAFAASMVIFLVNTKFRINMVPFLAVFAAFGICELWDAAANKKMIKFSVFLLIVALTGFINSFTEAHAPKAISGTRAEILSSLTRADQYREKRDYKNAIRELELTGHIKPNDAGITSTLGAVYFEMGDMKNAEKKFKEAIEYGPFFTYVYHDLGLLYNRQGRFDEAITILERAVSLEPRDAGLHFELGRAYKAKGDIVRARRELKSALVHASRLNIEDKKIIEEELKGL